jgi:molecular chaperone GrpE (heat shock protein)
MDEELKKMLREMKEEAGRNSEAVAKIVKIEERSPPARPSARGEEELDALREQIVQARRDFEDLKKRARVETLSKADSAMYGTPCSRSAHASARCGHGV